MICLTKINSHLFGPMQIIWCPWVLSKSLPRVIARCEEWSRRRILLVSHKGGAWYLGERVSRQSLGTLEQCIPKPPTLSMLLHDVKSIKYTHRALYGESATKYITKRSKESYQQFFAKLVSRICSFFKLNCMYIVPI